MNIKRLVVPFLLCCLALTLFLGTVKIGHATTSTYYFRDDPPTHGQPLGNGVDTGILSTTPPTSNEERHCIIWIQFWFDEDDLIQIWNITQITWHIYWKADRNATLGYQCNGT